MREADAPRTFHFAICIPRRKREKSGSGAKGIGFAHSSFSLLTLHSEFTGFPSTWPGTPSGHTR
jgi:hypothetical protein